MGTITPKKVSRWRKRTMAAAVGISEASVRHIWRAHGLKPHRVETFKISNDPAFAEKLEDIVGLYLNPPEHALVLCADEKSQIQALDRTQKSLPLFPGRLKTLTHDYKRNGTATLFAALNAANGEVFGLCQEQHRHQEWLKFLRLIDHTIRPTDSFTCSAITTLPISTPKCSAGWHGIHAFICTSLPPAHHGSTWWNASFDLFDALH